MTMGFVLLLSFLTGPRQSKSFFARFLLMKFPPLPVIRGLPEPKARGHQEVRLGKQVATLLHRDLTRKCDNNKRRKVGTLHSRGCSVLWSLSSLPATAATANLDSSSATSGDKKKSKPSWLVGYINKRSKGSKSFSLLSDTICRGQVFWICSCV